MLKYIVISFCFVFAFVFGDNVPPTDITGKSHYYSLHFGTSDDEVLDCVQLTKGCLYQVYGRVCAKYNFVTWPDTCHPDYEGYQCWMRVHSHTSDFELQRNGELAVTPINEQLSERFGEIYFPPGIYNVRIEYGRTNPHTDLDRLGRYNGGDGYLVFSYFGECPNTSRCNQNTCQICSTRYCANHDSHYTGYATHSQIGVAGDTYHYHCSNSQDLLTQWLYQLKGTCEQCNANYCKICGHTCEGLEVGCPNGIYCQRATCNICHGTFCSKHNIHLCSGFSYYSGSGEYEPFTVQTSILGQAQVSVNVNANSQAISNIEISSMHTALMTDTISGKLIDTNSKLDSIGVNVGDIENALNTHSGKMQGLGSELKQTIGDILSTNNVIKNNMQSVMYSVDANTSHVATVESRVTELRDDVRSSATILNNGFLAVDENQVIGLGIQRDINENVSTGFRSIVRMEDYVSAIDSKMSQDVEKLTRLVESGVYTEQELASIKDSIEIVASLQVDSNDVIVGKIGSGIESHYAVVRSLPTKLDNIAEKLENISKPDLSAIESSLDSIADNTSDIDSIAESSSSIDEKLDSTNSIIGAFRSDINTLLSSSLVNQSIANSRLESIDSKLGDLSDSLNDLNSGFGAGSPVPSNDFEDFTPGQYSPVFRIGQSFQRCRNKLVPDFGNITGDNVIRFTIPNSIGSLTRSGASGISYEFDLLDSRLEPLFNCSRAICIFGYSLLCIYGCLKVVRQY